MQDNGWSDGTRAPPDCQASGPHRKTTGEEEEGEEEEGDGGPAANCVLFKHHECQGGDVSAVLWPRPHSCRHFCLWPTASRLRPGSRVEEDKKKNQQREKNKTTKRLGSSAGRTSAPVARRQYLPRLSACHWSTLMPLSCVAKSSRSSVSP